MFNAFKKIGIKRIEPCITLIEGNENPSFWSVTKLKTLFPVLQDIGLKVISCHIQTANLLQDAQTLCNLTKDFGITHFVFNMPAILTELSLQESAFTFRKVADELAEYGARILIHNGKPDTEVKINETTAYEYFIDICLGKVGMQLDSGWAACGGVDPLKLIARNKERIESFHFKDFEIPGESSHDCVIGDGSLDNKQYIQFVRAKGIPLFIDADYYDDVLRDVKKSFDYLQDAGAQREYTVSYLNVYDTKTATVKVLSRFDCVIEAPNWVSTKNCLVYNSEGSIFVYNLDTKKSTKIDSGIANKCNNDHVVSHDEKLIAVSSDSQTQDGSGSRIFVLPLNGGQAKLITKNAPSYLHGFSPDMKELAYCAFRTYEGKNQVDIYTIATDGGEEKRLTTEGFNDGPEYSPDGKHIWYISTKSGTMQVYRMNRDGSGSQQMTFEDQHNWFAHVSPNGKKVVNISYRKNDLLAEEHLPNMQVSLWMMDYDGTNRHKLFDFFGGQGSINVNSWSADSRYFAFVSYEIVL